MMRLLFCFALVSPNIVIGQHLFNNDSVKVFFKGFTNIYNCEKGTPLCFDGSVKITPSNNENKYYVEGLLSTGPTPSSLSKS